MTLEEGSEEGEYPFLDLKQVWESQIRSFRTLSSFV